MPIPEIASQQFVRADLEDIDIDIDLVYTIKRYIVYVISNDSCSVKKIPNAGNKINDETRQAFGLLKDGDVIFFKDIFIEDYPEGEIKLQDQVFTVYK